MVPTGTWLAAIWTVTGEPVLIVTSGMVKLAAAGEATGTPLTLTTLIVGGTELLANVA